MPSFLVESYLAPPDRDHVGELARRAHALESSKAIRHVGSVILLEDEICFHIFQAPSAEALVEASQLAGLAHERMVETTWIAGTSASRVVEPI